MALNIIAETQNELTAAYAEVGETLGRDFGWYQPSGPMDPLATLSGADRKS